MLPWNWFSLSFHDHHAEAAFRYYFSSLNEHKLRRRLLLLNFIYMCYATLEWGTRAQGLYSHKQQSAMTGIRTTYILINMLVFTLSYRFRSSYRRHINLFSSSLSLLTSTMIIIEGFLLKQIYSIYLLIMLVMYIVAR